MTPKSFMAAVSAMAAFFAVCLFSAPFVSPYGSFLGLDGTPGVIDHYELWSGKDPFTFLMYTFGDIFCHQEEARVFILNGSEMPVCVRDIGICIGVALGALAAFMFSGNDKLLIYTLPFAASSFILILADWTIQRYFVLNIPVTRIITGVLAGIGVSLILNLWAESRMSSIRP